MLRELKVEDKPALQVLNKIDLLRRGRPPSRRCDCGLRANGTGAGHSAARD